jgi:cellobiose-specific phosphotransferase system component IIC
MKTTVKKILGNEQGVALVTSLMLTLIALMISLVMLYMVAQGTRMSGMQKRYKNSVEAAVGNVDIVTMDIIPYLMSFTSGYTGTAGYYQNNLTASINAAISPTVLVSDACLNEKLTKPTPLWSAACTSANRSVDAKQSADISVILRSQITGLGAVTGFRVYSKIISTTIGSSDLSGRNLEGQSTTGQPPQDVGAPYLYRIEVTGERESNPLERSNISVLYAY